MYSALNCIGVNWYAWFRVLHVLIQGAFLCLDIRAGRCENRPLF